MQVQGIQQQGTHITHGVHSAKLYGGKSLCPTS